jgi:hypothetical protein
MRSSREKFRADENRSFKKYRAFKVAYEIFLVTPHPVPVLPETEPCFVMMMNLLREVSG